MSTSIDTNVWGRILHSLEGRLTHQTLETWFRPIQFERLDNSQQIIHLRAPNQIVKDWVVTNYATALDESLNEQRLSGYSVGWAIGKLPDWAPEPVSSGGTASADEAAIAVEDPAALVESAVVVLNPTAAVSAEPSLSSKYTYDRFVVGSCNQFAHAASLAHAGRSLARAGRPG